MPKWNWHAKVAIALTLVGGVIAVLSWLFWPNPTIDPPRERSYLSSTACLLTDNRGLADEQAEAARVGMREASLETRIKVQYLSVSGPQTPANAAAYFNNLGLQKCVLIIAVGNAPVAAMKEGSDRFPDSRHVAISPDDIELPEGITRIRDTSLETLRSSVRQLVSDAAQSR